MTPTTDHPATAVTPPEPAALDLPVNALARSYQPRRVWAAAVSIAWNLLLASLFVFTGPLILGAIDSTCPFIAKTQFASLRVENIVIEAVKQLTNPQEG